MDQLYGKFVGKCEWHNLVNRLCKLQPNNIFYFIFYFNLFYTYGKAKYHPCVYYSPNTVFI